MSHLPPLVLKVRHLHVLVNGSAFCWNLVCLSWQWEGCSLGLGLVVEDKPTEIHVLSTYTCMA